MATGNAHDGGGLLGRVAWPIATASARAAWRASWTPPRDLFMHLSGPAYLILGLFLLLAPRIAQRTGEGLCRFVPSRATARSRRCCWPAGGRMPEESQRRRGIRLTPAGSYWITLDHVGWQACWPSQGHSGTSPPTPVLVTPDCPAVLVRPVSGADGGALMLLMLPPVPALYWHAVRASSAHPARPLQWPSNLPPALARPAAAPGHPLARLMLPAPHLLVPS